MTKRLFEKMFVKPEYSVAVLNMPQELKGELMTSQKVDTSLQNTYHFILAFYSKKDDIKEDIAQLKKSLLQNGLLWIAYPKGKALQTDLHRDILHSLMKEQGIDGVSLVSLNSTWSAMRFKVV